MNAELETRRTMSVLRQQLARAQQGQGAPATRPTQEQVHQRHLEQQQPQQQPAGLSGSATVSQRWTDTPDHRRLHATLSKVANARGEIMVALANDVMMCTNRKTCWWNGGNVLETFLKGVSRLKVSNVVVVTACSPFHCDLADHLL